MATKKKTTRAAGKKASAKKTPKSKNKMVSTSVEHSFWLHDGPALKNLKELSSVLGKMTEAQFNYHVNQSKNDFAAWVEYVLHDPLCAKKLKQCKNKEAAKVCVLGALKKYH